MKKLLSLILALALALGMVACGGGDVAVPEDSVYRDDVQEYITDILDESAEITIFEKKSSEKNEDSLVVTCLAMYEGDAGESKATFTLTYALDGKEWELEKCSVKLSEEDEKGNDEKEPDETEPEETEPEETEPPKETKPSASVALSDDWKDFTFELAGVTYQLPMHYDQFVANGWKLDGTRSDVTEDYLVPGYTRVYAYLTNGAVYFSVEFVNMSGHARAVKDCDIGAITIEANDNLALKLAKDIHILSTVDEIQAAFGTPSSMNAYTDYSSLKYEVDTYIVMSFYVYSEKTTYNEVTLRNLIPTDRDETVVSEERPAYLDDYVAPTELGDDITDTVFELDGVLYQLPCPIEEFTNNGWVITSDSIGTLGAMNESSGITMKKDGNTIFANLTNFSDKETYSRNCAVSGIQLQGYYFKEAAQDIVKLPGGVHMWSTIEEVEELYKYFDRYDGSYSTSFTYDSDDYTIKVRYAYYAEDAYGQIDIKNENWAY